MATKMGQKRTIKSPPKPRPKRVAIKPVSVRQTKRLVELNKLTTKLKALSGSKSELSGKWSFWLEPHHIMGRVGKKLLNPFNMILLDGLEHKEAQAHMSYERKQELLKIVKPLRLSQGFKETDYEN